MTAAKGKRVLFAVTSPYGVSRSALDKATRLASALNAELELFYRAFDSDVIHPQGTAPHHTTGNIEAYVERRREILSALAEELRATGLRTSAHVAWNTRSDEGILAEVSRWQPDFLVIEAFPRSPDDGVLSYQTHHKLMQACPCPLLLVRNALPYPSHPRVLAAVDPMHSHAKTPELDQAIVSAASVVADALAGDLHLFHARVPWAEISNQLHGPSWIPDIVKDENQVRYEHLVAALVTELAKGHNVPDLRSHLVDGDVRDCLPAFTRAESIDIVAIGILSRSFLQRLMIGDTARSLLGDLECDVLIVKQPGFHAEP